mmetsp:Transcript_2239/g.5106  ORF Transcript_2239/g.5106 Transcript_2239/m.5106 type:complete len:271 (+) Transcript_2239:1328-2140(+)
MIGEVDRRVHHAGAVRANRVGNVLDGNCVEVFLVRRLLDKHLCVHVVVVSGYEDVNVAHYLEDIKTLTVVAAPWEVDLCHLETVLLIGKVAHLGIDSPVVKSDSGKIVERHVQVVGHLLLDVDHDVEEFERPHLKELAQVLELDLPQARLLEHDAMDVQPQIVFYLPAEGFDNLLLEVPEDLVLEPVEESLGELCGGVWLALLHLLDDLGRRGGVVGKEKLLAIPERGQQIRNPCNLVRVPEDVLEEDGDHIRDPIQAVAGARPLQLLLV